MVWFKPKALYKDFSEGDSFESSLDNLLITIDPNLLSTGTSAAPAASSSSNSRTANDASAGADSFALQQGAKALRTFSSKSNSNKVKKVKKARTPLSFFNTRKMKERTGAFPMAEQSENQKVRTVYRNGSHGMLYSQYIRAGLVIDVSLSLFCLLLIGVLHFTPF
jgi:hypothetical protein